MCIVEEFQKKLDNYCDGIATDQEKAEVESWLIYTARHSAYPRNIESLETIKKGFGQKF